MGMNDQNNIDNTPKHDLPFTTIYVDESGNKFDKDMFQESPFFVYAWLLATPEQEEEINNRITELIRKEGLPKGSELRAKNMWASSRGLRRFNDIMRVVQNSGARTYITFTEKRFEVCVLICETYLDYIDDSATTFYNNLELKRRLMNVIYETVTDDFLNEFRVACLQDDTDLITRIGVRLANILALHPDNNVSRVAKMIETGSKIPFRFGQRFPKGPQNIHLITSHLSLFSISLIFFESELESQGVEAKIIRDQDSVHGQVLDYVFRFLTNDIKLRNLVGCEEQNSKCLMGLQIADLIAGATERVLRAKYHKNSLAQINRSIWEGLRLSLSRGKWTYQLTSELCEMALESLWDYKNLPPTKPSGIIDPQNPPSCNCGQIISSGRIRDFYSHIMEAHPGTKVMGIRCEICKKLVPFWLHACHQTIEHHIEPPFRGDFYSDMQRDYGVLQDVLKSNIKIVELEPPKGQSSK